MNNFDLVIIGGGPGGYSAAETAGLYGLKTAIIEKDNFGGVCLNVGCIPTKALLKSAKVHSYVKNAKKFGVDITSNPNFSWALMQDRKNKIVNKLRLGVESLLKSKKVTLIKGEAKIIDKNSVKVNNIIYKTKNIIIATGSSPVMLPLKGFSDAFAKGFLLTSREALHLDHIPKSIIIVGGGVIGVEFAALFAELGSKVTIIQGMPTILEMLDRDVSLEMEKILKSNGIKIILNALVKEIEGNNIIYEIRGVHHKEVAEKVLLAVGRKPNLNASKLLNIKLTSRKQYAINEFMQTSFPNIYAVGDCSSPLMLAHVAYRQADIAIAHIKGINRGKFILDRIPWCLYLYPEGAGVGPTEEEIKKKGIDYLKASYFVKHLGKALVDGDDAYGFLKLIIDTNYGQILSCQIVGANASDMISEIVAIMELETTIYELASTCHPHPSMSELIYEVAKKLAYLLDKKKGITS